LIIAPIVLFVIQIGATAPKPIAGYIDLDKNKPILLERVLPEAMRKASTGSLSTFSGPTEFDPNKDFFYRHYNRRCALLDELYNTRSSQFSGSAGFLN